LSKTAALLSLLVTMPRSGGSSAKASSSSKLQKGEIQRQKSPAEFFADNQAIAGFDNYGKSLYTSIRELMENSLVSDFE
jgi:DNA topoisomerase-6 subunit B